MQASPVIQVLRARQPANQKLKDYVPQKPYAEDLLREILAHNAVKIDAAIVEAANSGKNYITLGGWGDDGDVHGVIGEELTTLRKRDYRSSGEWPFSRGLTARAQSVLRRWVLERYSFEADFFDSSDGCNSSWIITFYKPFEVAQG